MCPPRSGRDRCWQAVRCAIVAVTLALAAGGRASVTLVTNGHADAVVVLPDEATQVERYAAEELVSHVERATKARLAITTESALPASRGSCIYVGDTRAARAAGIDVAHLSPEEAVLKTAGGALYLVGGDGAGEPLDTGTFAGTLFAVYECLEREVGVRWLWPGELGTFVPHTSSLHVRDLDLRISPAFFQRNVRGGLTFKSERGGVGFTPEVAAEYARDQAVFLRRHRMGRNVRLSYHHAFTDWWRKYGAEHPEWFQLVNGKRGPTKPGGSYSMCVSNPEFRHQIITLWQQQRVREPGLHVVNAVENGIMGLCECERCRAWDGPVPADYLKYYPPKSKVMGSRFVTDRYARYWVELLREAQAIDPEATIVAYNYFNYFPPPTPGTKLDRHILVGAYPSAGWFPRSPEEHAWFKRQWSDWAQTGARLFSRGNYCLDGYTMPLVFAHQYADEFQYQGRHGLEATDYDALTGQWAAQGPNLYLLVRLHTKPTAPVDELLAEYYTGFGAAAVDVKAYFDYWERYVAARRELINRQFEDNTSRWRSFGVAAHLIFPPESFAAAADILARARKAAAGDDEASRRVAFVAAGLEHARLCARVSQFLSIREPAASPESGQAALRELAAFRRAHEREWIANLNHCAWVEDASWRMPEADAY